jgi:hypothetical protein
VQQKITVRQSLAALSDTSMSAIEMACYDLQPGLDKHCYIAAKHSGLD